MAKATRSRRDLESGGLLTPPKFLSGLTSEQRKLVLEFADRRRYRAADIIVSSGDLTTHLFLLVKGRVKYYQVTKKGEEILLWWVAAGDIFGIGALLATPAHYIGTAEAVDECELLVWNRKKILELAATYPVLTENALRIVLYYLLLYADRLVGLTTDTADRRLARTLLRLGQRAGRMGSQGVEVAITNEHLAGLANVSAFTASRQLKKLQRQGVIHKHRGIVVILSPERLLAE
jgi:CRP-like cAMP-binding protein